MIPTLPPLRPRPSDTGTLLSARVPLPRRDRRAAKLVPLAPLAAPRKPAPPSSPRPPLWRTLLLVLAILLAEFFLVRRCAAPSLRIALLCVLVEPLLLAPGLDVP